MSARDSLVEWKFRLQNARDFTRKHPHSALVRLAGVAIMLLSAVFFVVPLYWLFISAFKPPNSIDYPPQLIPSEFSLQNFVTITTETEFVGLYLLNSVAVALGAVVIVLVLATPAGYAFSRYDIKYKQHLMVAILFVQMIPFLAMVIPLYRIFSVLGLLDTLFVITLLSAANTTPVATWLIKGYFDTVPDGLEEAARVGGASRLQAFRVIVPLARPALGAVSLYAFVGAWNQFIIPLTFISSQSKWVYPVALYEFISLRGVVNWGLLGAASLIAMLPVLLLFVVFQRQFVAGLKGTEFKG